MGRGRELSTEEKAKVDVRHRQGYSYQSIADIIKRSKTAVGNHIRRLKGDKAPKNPGRPTKLTPIVRRALIRHALREKLTARQLSERTQVGVTVRTVQSVLQEDDRMVYGKIKARPALKRRHIRDRYKWAKQMSFKTVSEWRKVVFTDEKRFCLDGPDGQACFWGDKRLE